MNKKSRKIRRSMKNDDILAICMICYTNLLKIFRSVTLWENRKAKEFFFSLHKTMNSSTYPTFLKITYGSSFLFYLFSRRFILKFYKSKHPKWLGLLKYSAVKAFFKVWGIFVVNKLTFMYCVIWWIISEHMLYSFIPQDMFA